MDVDETMVRDHKKQDIRVLFGQNALDRPLNPLDVERNHPTMGSVFMEETIGFGPIGIKELASFFLEEGIRLFLKLMQAFGPLPSCEGAFKAGFGLMARPMNEIGEILIGETAFHDIGSGDLLAQSHESRLGKTSTASFKSEKYSLQPIQPVSLG
jgi:hypothetical protein